MLYPTRCFGCDDLHQLTQEEHDIVEAGDEPFLCDKCFREPATLDIHENLCACTAVYGMRKSSSGPGFFMDSDPGVYMDTSKCKIHGR